MNSDFVMSTIRKHRHPRTSGIYEARAYWWTFRVLKYSVDLGLLCKAEARSVGTHHISFPDAFISDT